MIDLNEIAVFVSVAQLGSFTGAARALSMPVSTVSRRIADLEQQLGVTLIQRTTRKLTLTAQGRDYFDQCSEPLAHLYDAERVLTHSQRHREPGFSVAQLLRRSRTRNRSHAVDLLRLADRERHVGAPPAEVELAAGVGSRRVSHAQVPAREDASLPASAA